MPCEGLVVLVGEDLHAELPLRVGTRLDRVREVTAVEVRVDPPDHLRLLPGQGVHPELRLPVELDQGGLTLGVDQPEGVDAEALHRPVGPRDPAVGHVPHGVVLRLGVQRHEVPEGVVGTLGLRDLTVGVRLAGMDDVGELDAVLDEEHRDVVADEVEGALLGVELRREPPGVADGVCRTPGAEHGREAHEDRRLDVLGKETGLRDRLRVAVADEDSVRSCAPGVHDPLRDPLVVEVRDLLAQVVVLEERGPTLAGLERVVGVPQACSLGGRQEGALLGDVGRRRSGVGTRGRTTVGGRLVGFRRQWSLGLGRLLERGRLWVPVHRGWVAGPARQPSRGPPRLPG